MRKQHEDAAQVPQRHWKTFSNRAPDLPPAPDDAPVDLERVDQQLLALASVLTGQKTPGEGVTLAGGVATFRDSAVADLGRLVGTPRDMTVAAASELRAAIRDMLSSDSQ